MLLGVVLVGAAFLMSASPKQVVRDGDSVTIDYTLRLADGTVFDTSIGREPLNATLGEGTLLASFERELLGMRVGETRAFSLTPDQAYGEYRPEMVGTLDRSQFAEDFELKVGKQVRTEFRDGTPAIAYITSFTDTTVTLDANHPLAGQLLKFEVQLIAIRNNTASAVSNQAIRNSPWLGVAAAALMGMVVFFSMRKRQPSTITKKRTNVLLKQRRHA